MRTSIVAGLTALVLMVASGPVRADEPAPPSAAPPLPSPPPPPPSPALALAVAPPAKPRYFYQGLDYGSQALFGPLWVFVNRGYDVLQDHVAGRNIFTFDYRTNLGNVARNIANPFPAIAADGWKTFLTEEIFPLTFTSERRRAGRPTTASTSSEAG